MYGMEQSKQKHMEDKEQVWCHELRGFIKSKNIQFPRRADVV